MIPHPTMDVTTIDSTIDGESIDMSIDESALAHIMSVLTDLYSDTMLACVREYSTNARDSHIEAGKADVPIEISTPSSLSPVFKVRDFGVGLSLEDIRNVYSKYGSSTKRGSNDVNGMLGLGAKAALTYTSSFTVVSVKGGMKNIISVGRNAEGGGHMEIVDSFPTDEPNGVEIQIPVSTYETAIFSTKVDEFFKYWDDGTVMINGVINSGSRDGFTQMDKEGKVFFSNVNHVRGRNIIVMGGVAYESPFRSPFHGYNSGFIYFADMGEVSFSPSRESLFTNKQNRDVFDKVVSVIQAAAKSKAVEEVKAAPTAIDALKAISAANQDYLLDITGNSVDRWSYEYNGEPLTKFRDRIIKAAISGAPTYNFHIVSAGSKINVHTWDGDNLSNDPKEPWRERSNQSFSNIAVDTGILLSGVDGDILTNAGRRTVIMRGLRHLGHTHKKVLAMSDTSAMAKELGNNVTVVTIDEVKEASRQALKQNRSSSTKPKRAKMSGGMADVITGIDSYATMTTEVRTIDPKGNKAVHLPRGEVRTGTLVDGYNSHNRAVKFRSVMGTFSDYTFVAVPESREEKFRKTFPKAQSYYGFIKDHSGQKFIDEVVSRSKGTVTANDVAMWGTRDAMRNRAYYLSDNCKSLVERGLVTSGLIAEYTESLESIQLVSEFASEVSREWGVVFDRARFGQFVESNCKVDKSKHHSEILNQIGARYPLVNMDPSDGRGYNGASVVFYDHLKVYIDAVDSNSVN